MQATPCFTTAWRSEFVFCSRHCFLPINSCDYFREKRNIVGNLTFGEAAQLAVNAGGEVGHPDPLGHVSPYSKNFARFADWLYRHARHQHFHILHAGELFVYAREG